MPSLDEIRTQIRGGIPTEKYSGGSVDAVRQKYIRKLSELTGRNVILYYSGWLQMDPRQPGSMSMITDDDKHGFMSTVHELDTSKGLDLILHTPGGVASATESLIDYLRQKFGTDIRAIVPHMAMSSGTMIAFACKEILMGKQSNLGPIDPQIRGMPAGGILAEFNLAYEDMKADGDKALVWQPIISGYGPSLIWKCQKALEWARDMSVHHLATGMFKNDKNAELAAGQIVSLFVSHDATKSHDRHVSINTCKKIGLKILEIEKDQELQDTILSIHNASVLTATNYNILKIIENQNGRSYIKKYRPS